MKLSDEMREDIFDACLDDSTKIIRYLEEKDQEKRRRLWMQILVAIGSWFGGIVSALLVQYLSKLWGLH